MRNGPEPKRFPSTLRAILCPLAAVLLSVGLCLSGTATPRAQSASWRATTNGGVDVRSMFSLGLTCGPILRTYYESLPPAERASRQGQLARDRFATMAALIEAMAKIEGFDQAYVRQAKAAAERRLEQTLLAGDYFILLRVCLEESEEIVAGLEE